MNDPLADFLKQGMAALEAAPFDFFVESTPPAGIDGVHAAVFFEWAGERGLLDESAQRGLASIAPAWRDQAAARVDAIGAMLGGSIRPEHFSPRGRAFANRYYRPGWSHSYLVDLEQLFPSVQQLSQIEPSAANLDRMARLLDERLRQFEQDSAG
jgi:hypothetical protein